MSNNLTTLFDSNNETGLLPRIIHRSFGLSISLAVLFTILTILTALGNIFVITAVARIKKLQHPSNLLIVSLACSDLLVSIVVMPFGSYYEYTQVWDLGEVACDIFIVFDVLLCTASILNICAISIDRYLVITRPLAYDTKRTPKRMLMMITIAWVSAALISIPPTFGFKDPFTPGVCAYSKNFIYQIYATFGAFYLPLLVMLILYGRIVVLARNIVQSERNRQTSNSDKGQITITPSASESQVKQGCFSCNCWGQSANRQIRVGSLETVRRDSSFNNALVLQFDTTTAPKHNASTERKLDGTFLDEFKYPAGERTANAYPVLASLPKTTAAATFTGTSGQSLVLATALKYRDRGETLHHYSRLPHALQQTSSQSNGLYKTNISEDIVSASEINAVSERQSSQCFFSAPCRSQMSISKQQFSLQTPSPSHSARHDPEGCYPCSSKSHCLDLRGSRSRAQSVNVTNLCGPHRRRQPPCSRHRGSSGTYSQQQQQAKKASRRRSSEKKAIRTLGVLMGVFCFCWLPFFIVALGLPLYNYVNKTKKDINPHFKSVLLWLGYINSTINPMIYTIFNRDFRQPFYEILHCRCRGINARMRVKQYEHEYGPRNSYIFHSDTAALNPRLSTQAYSPFLVNKRDTREHSLVDEKPP
ncbi:hypothetical protein AAHC03_0422 [Spirometra sp. Aus1]